ncbi:MAG: tetratricopeptide repeat protein [Nitrospirota bacterium]
MIRIFLERICIPFTILILFYAPLSAREPEWVSEQKKAIVTISIEDREKRQVASARGFVVDRKGIMATDCSIIRKWFEKVEYRIVVMAEGGGNLPFDDLVSKRCENNLALFRVKAQDLAAIQVSGDNILEKGAPVFLFPETGMEPPSEILIKDAIARGKVYRLSWPISPGLSGSPLFNAKGEVVGAAVLLSGKGKTSSAAVSLSPVLRQLDIRPEPAKSVIIKSVAPKEAEKKISDAESYVELALAHYKEGRYTDAIAAYGKALKIKPEASIYKKLGSIYLIRGEYGKACDTFKNATGLSQDDASAHFNLGLACFLSGDKKMALEEYEILRKIDAERARSLRELME